MEKPKPGRDDDGLMSSSSSVDRISELPHPILHRILCYLSQKEAVQTCVISKSWRHLWCTRPTLEFGLSLFRGNMKTFTSILGQTLQRYRDQNLSINRFVVETSDIDLKLSRLLRKWIPKVLLSMGVETFHLISYISDYYYALPSEVHSIFQAQFLKELYLQGWKIESSDANLCLNRLQTLSLTHVQIGDETLEKIITSCPLLESVELCLCKGLTTIKVNNNNLKHFGCWVSGRDVEINAPSALETIKIGSRVNWYLYRSNENYFPRLKSLYLRDVHLSEDFSDIVSCNSPCLEELVLSSCTGFNHVSIWSRSVKRLTIEDEEDEIMTITIDAPGMLYFEFSCPSSVPSISFGTVGSSEWKSNISFLRISNDGVSPWFLKLHEVVNALRHSQITLYIHSGVASMEQHIEGNTHVDCYEPVAVERLDFGRFVSSVEFPAMFSWLFRFLRPRYIHMRMSYDPLLMLSLENSKLADFMCKTNLKDGELIQCYLWQQELKELRLELLDDDSKKWCLVQGSRSQVIAPPKYKMVYSNIIRFVFDWR